MGEYAKLKTTGEQIKIGTCENMYYLRFEDRYKVIYDSSFTGYRFRLPFPDEDKIEIGNYQDFDRGIDLIYHYDEETESYSYFDDIYKEHYQEHKGLIQLKHENSGLLINAACYHGYKLPDNNNSKELKAFFNGKSSSNFELSQVKIHLNEETKVKELIPIVRCKHCKTPFRADWSSVLLHIRQHTKEDKILYERLSEYATTTTHNITKVF
jgi:hypothetical protein